MYFYIHTFYIYLFSHALFIFSDYNRGTIISHNTMFRLGDNGIVLVGEARLIDGSIGNQPRGVQILYNLITENGIWGKQVYFNFRLKINQIIFLEFIKYKMKRFAVFYTCLLYTSPSPRDS